MVTSALLWFLPGTSGCSGPIPALSWKQPFLLEPGPILGRKQQQRTSGGGSCVCFLGHSARHGRGVPGRTWRAGGAFIAHPWDVCIICIILQGKHVDLLDNLKAQETRPPGTPMHGLHRHPFFCLPLTVVC